MPLDTCHQNFFYARKKLSVCMYVYKALSWKLSFRQHRLHSTSWYTEFTIVPSPSLLETDSLGGSGQSNRSEGGRLEERRTEREGLGSFLITPAFTKQAQKAIRDRSACLLWVTASIHGPYGNPNTAEPQTLNSGSEDKEDLPKHWTDFSHLLGRPIKCIYSFRHSLKHGYVRPWYW